MARSLRGLRKSKVLLWPPRCAQTPSKSHSKCRLDSTWSFKLVSMASKMAFGAPTRPPYSQNDLQLALQLAFQGCSGPSKSVVGSSKIMVLAFWAVEVLSDCPFAALRAFLDAFLGSTWSSWRPLGLNLEPLGRLLGSTWSLLGASWAPLGRLLG